MRPTLVLALLAATPAWAEPPCVCDPPWSFPAWPEVPPPLGNIDASLPDPPHVPTNARLFVTWAGAQVEWFELARDDGAPVPFTAEPASDDPGQFWIQPAAPLEAGRSYTLREGDNTITFVVDDVEDTAPPAHTRVVGQGARLRGRCPEHVAAEVRAVLETELEGDEVDAPVELGEPYGVLYEVTVRRLRDAAAPAPRRFFLRGAFPTFGEVVSDDYRFQACFENYQDAETTWDYEATVRVWDQAGNVADAPEEPARRTTFRFAYNVSEGCGCVAGGRAPVPAGAALAGLLAVLVYGLRRARSSSAASSRRS